MTRLSYECDVCVLGGPGIGKSSLILHYTKGIFLENIESSVEDLYQKQATSQGVSKIISILDTNANVDAYSTSRKEQIKNAATLVFAYSIDDRDSFLKVSDDFERNLGVMKTLPLSINVNEALDPIVEVALQNSLKSEPKSEPKSDLDLNSYMTFEVESAAKADAKSETKSETNSEGRTEMKSGSSTPQTVERNHLRSMKKEPDSLHQNHCCIVM